MKTSHKIYLQGDMALRFGESFTFTGDRVQDALRCVYANRPDFKEYLIECHEKGYNFVVDTQDTDIDTPEEYFLPVLKGDVIISAIPAGSGSGFGKILAAAAIFTLIFAPGLFTAFGGKKSCCRSRSVRLIFTKSWCVCRNRNCNKLSNERSCRNDGSRPFSRSRR